VLSCLCVYTSLEGVNDFKPNLHPYSLELLSSASVRLWRDTQIESQENHR
jgi:hypothetical protein